MANYRLFKATAEKFGGHLIERKKTEDAVRMKQRMLNSNLITLFQNTQHDFTSSVMEKTMEDIKNDMVRIKNTILLKNSSIFAIDQSITWLPNDQNRKVST